MQESASGMTNVWPFLIRYAKSYIDCQPHEGCSRFGMIASIHLSHSFATCSIVSMTISPR